MRLHIPISVRLTLWYGVSMAVILAITGTVVVSVIHRQGHQNEHRKLFGVQNDLIPRIGVGHAGVVLPVGLDTLGGVHALQGPFAVFTRLVDPTGVIVDQSRNASELNFPPQVPEAWTIREIQHREVGVLYQTMYSPVESGGKLIGWLESSAYAWEGAAIFTHGMYAVGALVTLVLSLLGGFFLSRRALNPISKVTAAADRISATDIRIRLKSDGGVRDEVSDLTETFNEMLARLEASFEREKRLTADAAHEILNPLSVISSETQYALRRERSKEELLASLQTIDLATVRLGHLLKSLMELSRAEGDRPDARGVCSVTMVTEQLLQEWARSAEAAGCDVSVQTMVSEDVTMSPEDLRTLLNVMVENAIKYSVAQGVVQVQINRLGADLHIRVRDNGIGLTDTEKAQLFDRFYRSDREEVSSTSGSGLGLSIASAIAGRYEASLEATSQGPGKGSQFTLVIPGVAART